MSAEPIDLERERVKQLIAHEGSFELLDAAWDLNSGRTVTLRVIESPGADVIHPFKKFTKRRNGRAGTRFHCSMTHEGTAALILNGEVQLAAWAEGSDKGQSVKFWIDEDASSHPFAGYRGKRGSEVGELFAGMFVELDDDETPINQKSRSQVEGGGKTGRNRISTYAHMLCANNDRFIQFLREKVARPDWMVGDWSPDNARLWIKFVCKIESIGDLNPETRPDKVEAFHNFVRRPFARFTGEL